MRIGVLKGGDGPRGPVGRVLDRKAGQPADRRPAQARARAAPAARSLACAPPTKPARRSNAATGGGAWIRTRARPDPPSSTPTGGSALIARDAHIEVLLQVVKGNACSRRGTGFPVWDASGPQGLKRLRRCQGHEPPPRQERRPTVLRTGPCSVLGRTLLWAAHACTHEAGQSPLHSSRHPHDDGGRQQTTESGPTGQNPVPRQAGNDRNASQAGLRRDRGPGKGCAGAMPTKSDASVAPTVLARQGRGAPRRRTPRSMALFGRRLAVVGPNAAAASAVLAVYPGGFAPRQ